MNRPDPIACGGFRWHSAASEWEFRALCYLRAFSHAPTEGHRECDRRRITKTHFPSVNTWAIAVAMIALHESELGITEPDVRMLANGAGAELHGDGDEVDRLFRLDCRRNGPQWYGKRFIRFANIMRGIQTLFRRLADEGGGIHADISDEEPPTPRRSDHDERNTQRTPRINPRRRRNRICAVVGTH